MRLVCYPVSFHCLKRIDYSMLPWVCSVIDHRRCQNVVRTKVAYEPQASVSLMFLPHLFDLIHDLLGSFSTDDGDGSENFKKAIGLISKTTTLHVQHTFLYISLPSLHDYGVKIPNFTFYGGRKQATTNFSFSFKT